MAASAKLVLVAILGLICLGLVSSKRVLKESVAHTESSETHSTDGSSSAWVTVAGSGQTSASASGYGSTTGAGTGVGIATGSGSGNGIGVGIGVGVDTGLGTGYGTGTGTGVGIGVGVGSGLGTGGGYGFGIGIGGGGGSGSGTETGCDRPACNNPPVEIPVWIPGECGDQGIVFEPPVCATSGCQEVRCNHGQSTGSSSTRKTDKGHATATENH